MKHYKVIILLVSLFACLNIHGVVSQISESGFSTATHCMVANCTAELKGIFRSKIECIASCHNNTRCTGFNFTAYGECHHFPEGCFGSTLCNYSGTSGKIFERRIVWKYCRHNGQLDQISNTCQCVGGWVGEECERLPYRCEELVSFGYPRQSHWVDIDVLQDGSRTVRLMCDLLSTKVYTYLVASNGFYSRNRTYQEYVDGYYINQGNYFHGLENIYALSSYYDCLTFAVIVSDSANGKWWQRLNYNNFTMSGADDGYTIRTFGYNQSATETLSLSSSQNLGDILGLSQQVSFSTYDRDRDNDNTTNCAALFGTGWWFHNCSFPINPLGYHPALSVPADMYIKLPGMDFNDQQLASKTINVFLVFATMG